jgi:hypothetical protein
MRTAPLPVWVTAALKGLAPGDPNYATVKKAVLALASRFTTAGVEPNRKFIETMRDVQAVGDLGAVIAGVAVLLDHPKGTEGMSADEARKQFDTYFTRDRTGREEESAAAATAPSGDAENDRVFEEGIAASLDGQPNEDMQKAAVDLLGELTRMAGDRASVRNDSWLSAITEKIEASKPILEDGTVDKNTQTKIRELVVRLEEQRLAQKAAVAQSADELKLKWEDTNMILYIEALQTLNTYVANENDIDYDTYEVEQALANSATLLEDRTMPTERQRILREAAAQAKLKYELDKRELQGFASRRLRTAALHPAPPSVLKF